MVTTTASAAVVPVTLVFTNTERLALAGFLAGHSGLTREAYELLGRRQHWHPPGRTGPPTSPTSARAP